MANDGGRREGEAGGGECSKELVYPFVSETNLQLWETKKKGEKVRKGIHDH